MPSLTDIGAVPLSEMAEGLRRAAKGIPLYGKGGAVVAFAMVDADDYPVLSEFRWYLASNGYARRHQRVGNRQYQKTYLHRQILQLKPGDRRFGDHINGDKLDNRRENLRICSPSANAQNKRSYGKTSQYRGVSWHKGGQKWMAYANLNGQAYYLGLHEDESAAATAASAWRTEHMPYAVESI